mgnify:CR=1 FL=1
MKHKSQSLWEKPNIENGIEVIDQRKLPFELNPFTIKNLESGCFAIKEMVVRGAPLIGVTAAYTMYFASLSLDANNYHSDLKKTAESIKFCRPTAVNLSWAVNRLMALSTKFNTLYEVQNAFLNDARTILKEDINSCFQIGQHGLNIIKDLYNQLKRPLNILTHCNAGRLACIKYGTATAPMYAAHSLGIPIHIWVDETRPRNQGAKLTAWELKEAGIKHSVITDNSGGYLMQKGYVDLVIVGTDRVAKNGDVANKIGTYLKALAAKEHNIPFYVALPYSTVDWELETGINEIPIENRSRSEVNHMDFFLNGNFFSAPIMDLDSPITNPGFDVTPARFISSFITEYGIFRANPIGLQSLKEHGLS